LAREELNEQFGENEMNSLNTMDLIKFAEEKNMTSILERYKAHAEKDIEKMKLHIDELEYDAFKYERDHSIFFNELLVRKKSRL
jgi:hypothetical protein